MEHESNNVGPFTELPQPQDANGTYPETAGVAKPEAVVSGQPLLNPLSRSSVNSPLPSSTATLPADDIGAKGPTTAVDQTALIADDADLIEKEWVIKAKAIVARTKDDPHSQNKEMNKVKADYLKKRYNKDLKVSEG